MSAPYRTIFKKGVHTINQKKGFVLYFDSLGLLSLFPPDQIGELLLALYDYACCICETEESPEEALSRYPQLDTATRVGFCSMAGHILRDTRKWKQRQTNCQQAALERHRKSPATGQEPPAKERSYGSYSYGRNASAPVKKLDPAWDYVE